MLFFYFVYPNLMSSVVSCLNRDLNYSYFMRSEHQSSPLEKNSTLQARFRASLGFRGQG